MFVAVDETLQIGIDCVAALSPRQFVAFGWTMTPRADETEIWVSAGQNDNCTIEHCNFHPRSDVVAEDPRLVTVTGFALVFAAPEDPWDLTLTLSAGTRSVRIDLRDPRIETNLLKATATLDWQAAFNLLQQCAGLPTLAPLLSYQGRPFGAFAEWITQLPVARGRVQQFGQLAEVECLATPAGEVMVMLRSAAPIARDADLAITLAGWIQQEDGGPAGIAILPLIEWHAALLPTALVGYARVDPAWLDRLQAVEMVVQARLGAGELYWMRCQPAAVAVPDFLDAVCRAMPASCLTPVEASASAAVTLLQQVIARREAAFAPALAALSLAPPDQAIPVRLPRMAVILGADDRMAARLFHVTASEFERRCDTLLVMGEAADDVAQTFTRRGRIRVLVGQEAVQALRETAGRAGVLVVDAAIYAQAIATGRPEDVFTGPLQAAELAKLLTLHAVAGCSNSLSDSLQRLLRLRRAAPGEAAFTPVPRAWANPQAADLVNNHLARLWNAGSAPAGRRLEHVLHG